MKITTAADTEFKKWLAKYEPVEQAIIKERAKRMASAEKRRFKRRREYGDELERTEGLAAYIRKNGPAVRQMGDLECILTKRIDPRFRGLDIGGAVVFLWSLGVKCTKEIDAIRHWLKRPIYYKREKARRRALAAERRKVNKRTTRNPCPTREEILDAWILAKTSREAMLHFGSLIEDLECYVDNSLRFGRGGNVVGRAPGIKGWIQLNIPVLYSKYKTIMRYKAAAKKLRQIVELKEPTPISEILSPPKASNTKGNENEIILRTKSNVADSEQRGTDLERERADLERGKGDLGQGRTNSKRGMDATGVSVEVLRARAVYLEAMDGVNDNATRTIERINELLDPERIKDATMLKAWKAKYENEITLRTKSRWWKKLFGKAG